MPPTSNTSTLAASNYKPSWSPRTCLQHARQTDRSSTAGVAPYVGGDERSITAKNLPVPPTAQSKAPLMVHDPYGVLESAIVHKPVMEDAKEKGVKRENQEPLEKVYYVDVVLTYSLHPLFIVPQLQTR